MKRTLESVNFMKVWRWGGVAALWSTCWYELHPWAEDGKNLPYITVRKERPGQFQILLGPLMLFLYIA